MKKLDFIKHPECFHGEKFLSNSSTYFEGWYFKISNGTDVKNSNFLLAPSKGKMTKEILESISSEIDIQIREKDKLIFSNSGFNSGLEIVI